jgi:hypothetical protein
LSIVVADFGAVERFGVGHIYEPVFGFGMNVHFWNCGRGFVASENLDDEVAVATESIVAVLLFGGEVPGNVKPMGVAGGEEDAAGAVSFGKFAGGWEGRCRKGLRREGVTGARTADWGARG